MSENIEKQPDQDFEARVPYEIYVSRHPVTPAM